MVPIFQVGFGYARSLVSLGLEGCAGCIEAIVYADVKSSVSWQAHIMMIIGQFVHERPECQWFGALVPVCP